MVKTLITVTIDTSDISNTGDIIKVNLRGDKITLENFRKKLPKSEVIIYACEVSRDGGILEKLLASASLREFTLEIQKPILTIERSRLVTITNLIELMLPHGSRVFVKDLDLSKLEFDDRTNMHHISQSILNVNVKDFNSPKPSNDTEISPIEIIEVDPTLQSMVFEITSKCLENGFANMEPMDSIFEYTNDEVLETIEKIRKCEYKFLKYEYGNSYGDSYIDDEYEYEYYDKDEKYEVRNKAMRLHEKLERLILKWSE